MREERPVHAPGHRTKTPDHPEAGALRLHRDVLPVPEDDQEVVPMTADPGSPAVRALRRPRLRTTVAAAPRNFSHRGASSKLRRVIGVAPRWPPRERRFAARPGAPSGRRSPPFGVGYAPEGRFSVEGRDGRGSRAA
ncbi:hypothetical protein ACH49G_19955 [Streptomyces chrestomyceticus]|uniref:MmyB family transcriptional regulator n=1 Tax=Streptomyces chrestomyceticus TaxID=68185 RepID=UPI0037B4A439